MTESSAARVEVERIRDQLRRAVSGDAWHGPSVAESIADLDAAGAWSRLSATTHSPVELVLHIAAWLEIVARRFAGETVSPTATEDWPTPPVQGDVAWNDCVQRLHRAHAALDRLLAAATDDRLGAIVPGQDITLYVMLHGMVQHSVYHAGQIILIRRGPGLNALTGRIQ